MYSKIDFLRQEFIPAMREYWYDFVENQYNFDVWFVETFPEIPVYAFAIAKSQFTGF